MNQRQRELLDIADQLGELADQLNAKIEHQPSSEMIGLMHAHNLTVHAMTVVYELTGVPIDEALQPSK